MKPPQSLIQRSLIIASALGLSVSAFAAPITYTSSYVPTALPTTSGGTVQNPSWNYEPTGTPSATIVDGVLVADTMPNASTSQFWRIGTSGATTWGTSSAWNINASTGGTIDFSLKVTDHTAPPGTSPQILGGFSLFFTDGSRGLGIFFDSTKISYWTGENTIGFAESRDNTSMQTYRIAVEGNKFSLYEAGSDVPIFDQIDLGAGEGNYFYWGDGTGQIAGTFELGFLGWNNSVAEFSAPPVSPIPEPSSMVLMGIAGLGIARFFKRSKTAAV